MPLDPAKYIQQPFAVIQGWYRIGVEWEDVEHIQSHEYQTINVLLDDQIIMTIDINKATLAR